MYYNAHNTVTQGCVSDLHWIKMSSFSVLQNYTTGKFDKHLETKQVSTFMCKNLVA